MREDGVVRPLIDCTRAQVMDHLRRHDLPHVVDPSNRDTRFERVRIRHTLLPALADEDPAVIQHLADLADDARAVVELVEAEAASLLTRATDGAGALSTAEVSACGRAVRRAALRRWAEQRSGIRPGRPQLEALDRLCSASGQVLLGGGWLVQPRRGRLFAEHRPEHPTRSSQRRE